MTGMQTEKKGTVYLVATPIGNMEDITLRALRVLKEVDIIAAEDTRQTIKLLNHYGIKKQMISYHEHNKKERGIQLAQFAEEGKNIAVVTDAGCPGISDPGEDIVKICHQRNVKVTMIPGASAAIAGLVLSGMATGRFVFEGFLPVNKRAKKERIETLKNEQRTVVLFEAPHKLKQTLNDLQDILGNRKITIIKELTKLHEKIYLTTLEEAVGIFNEQAAKGEYVLVLEGCSEMPQDSFELFWKSLSVVEHYEYYLGKGLDRKNAMKKVAEDRGVPKREIYRALETDM